MSFWDTSAIVPLCVNENRSAVVRQVWRRFPDRNVWYATPVGVFSTLSRLEREGVLTNVERIQAETGLKSIERGWNTVDSNSGMIQLARTFPATYGLRALDSLQLAAALVRCKEFPKNKNFVSADARLSKAAEEAGFAVIFVG